MAATEAAALEIHLHPLVVLSIGDHFTREVAQKTHAVPRCLGLLFGEQDGRVVKVLETLEVAFSDSTPSGPLIEQEAVEIDMKLFSEAYATYECLGWYSSGSSIAEHDYVLHNQMKKYNERPLFVMMDPSAAASAAATMKDLPLTVYEEAIHVVGDKTTSEFVKTPYIVQADEAERITVTFCAKVVNREESGSAISAHYASMYKSVSNLRDRIGILHQFLSDVKSKKIDITQFADGQQLLRDIKGLCLRLPVMHHKEHQHFRTDLIAEYNDALLVTYLSSITKATQQMAEVQEKYAVAHRDSGGSGAWDRRGRGAGGAGMDDEIMGMRSHRAHRGDGGFMGSIMSSFGVGMG